MKKLVVFAVVIVVLYLLASGGRQSPEGDSLDSARRLAVQTAQDYGYVGIAVDEEEDLHTTALGCRGSDDYAFRLKTDSHRVTVCCGPSAKDIDVLACRVVKSEKR